MRQLLCVAFLVPPVVAQLGMPLPDPNFPGGTHTINVQGATGNNGCLGCARDSAGNYWVSARGTTTAGSPHKLFKFGPNGTLSTTYDQPLTYSATAIPGATPWGIRDLAYDGSRYLYGGTEVAATNKVLAFDTQTGMFDPTKDWTAPAVATVRALAYDPNGNGGQGSMWTADFGADVVEFDRLGNVLTRIPSANLVSQNQTASFYGAAYDPLRKSVWFFSQGGSVRGTALPNGVRVVAFELDVASGVASGLVVFGDLTIPPSSGNTPGGLAGGCEFYMKNGNPTLLLLSQAASDTIYEIYGRFNIGNRCGGEIAFSGDAFFSGNAGWQVDLKNSPTTTGSGFLVIAGAQLSFPATLPFNSGCWLHFNPGLPFLLVGPVPISNGRASFPLPIPAVGPGNIVFQWVELPTGSPTLLSSDGGWAAISL